MRHSRLLLVAMLTCLAGCDDLGIKTDGNKDSYRFGGSLAAHLTYKDSPVPDDPSRGTCTWYVGDKVIGTGVSVVISNLPAGHHVIRAKVTGSGKTADAKKKIEVENDEPVVTISASAKKIAVGQPIALSATATDREDGTVSDFAWKIDGKDRGAGAAITVSDLVPGKHKVEALARDLAGETGSAKVELEITNDAPRVTIEEPSANLETRVYRAVSFRGSAIDPDPLVGPSRIPVDRLEWVSSKQGTLGQGEALTLTTLLPGEHEIELRARDEFGATGKARVTVVVKNDAPSVSIKKPRDRDEVKVGSEVRFECDASDPEDAKMEDSQITWRSQQEGELGHGRKIETKKLRPGVHEITCTAVDKFGAKSTDRIELVVTNDPPSVKIDSPADGSTFQGSDRIELRGSGHADNQGDLDGGDLTWFEGSKKLGTGRKLKLEASNLGPGGHELTLRARNKWGAEATTSVRVTIVRKPFEVTITSPKDGATFAEGAEIVLQGFAKDGDSGKKLGSDRLAWTTVFNAGEQPLGTGERLALTTLAPGVHQLQLTARDPNDPSVTRVATVRVRITGNATTTTAATTPARTTGITGAIGDATDGR